MFSSNDLCFYCLQPKSPLEIPCPHCKKDESSFDFHPLYLKPKTILKAQYLIGKVLGQGGFGITYLGVDIHLHKFVAIKEYLPTTLATREETHVIPLQNHTKNFRKGLHSFLEEAQHLARFNHPHIVRVLNYFEDNKTGYMVMEYIDGETPASLLKKKGGKLSVEQTFAILLPILDALEIIHAQHIYHLDISAHNILIDKNHLPILIDFGAARSINVLNENTHTLTLVLKAGYSPPEQYSGKGKIGPWTDIYACGALLYFLLSGKLPPAATDRLQNKQLENLDVSPHLNKVIQQALQLKIEQRFQNVQAFRNALLHKPTQKNMLLSLVLLISIVIFWGYVNFFSKKNTIPPMMLAPPDSEALEVSLTSPPLDNIDIVALTTTFIEERLKLAYQQIADLKLSTPPRDNAYESYLTLKKQAPHDSRIDALLEKIANAYLKLAQQQTSLEKKRSFLEKGLNIFPHHAGLKELELTLEKQTQKPSEIDLLLSDAQRLQHSGYLEQAADNYHRILTLQSDHKMAQQQLKQIAQQFAMRAQQSDSPVDGLVWITKALQLQPNQPSFLTLQETIRQQLNQPKEIIKEVIKEVEMPALSPLPAPVEKPEKSKSSPLLVTPSF